MGRVAGIVADGPGAGMEGGGAGGLPPFARAGGARMRVVRGPDSGAALGCGVTPIGGMGANPLGCGEHYILGVWGALEELGPGLF